MRTFLKYFVGAFAIVLVLSACRQSKVVGEDAHVSDTLELVSPMQPTFLARYEALSDENLEEFIGEWKAWSKELQSCATDSRVNEAVARIFKDYSSDVQTDTFAVYSLPPVIEVRRYPGRYRAFPLDDRWCWDDAANKEYMMRAAERFACVPWFETDKDIVYPTPEIERLLSMYVGGVTASGEIVLMDYTRWTEINEDRLAQLRKHISVRRNHWGGHWHLFSMPVIYFIYLYDDGFAAEFRISFNSGATVFFPYSSRKKKKVISEWIE